MTSFRRKRVAALISGRGSNLAALIEAAKDPAFPAEIVGVISNVAHAPGLEAARQSGFEARAITKDDHPGRDALDAATDAALVDMGAEIVCLAGYMRLLGPSLVDKWAGRLMNIHPSILPLFKGLDTHKRALDSGMLVHGCTVHFVTAEMDGGPIIAQAVVPVLPGDDETRLQRRVLRAEHRLYPHALRLVAEGRVRMEGGKAAFDGASEAERDLLISPATDTLPEASDLESLARFTP
jgi:phosphoribosylglycinamide formyltransferase 1